MNMQQSLLGKGSWIDAWPMLANDACSAKPIAKLEPYMDCRFRK
jgi:hypothetical protein